MSLVKLLTITSILGLAFAAPRPAKEVKDDKDTMKDGFVVNQLKHKHPQAAPVHLAAAYARHRKSAPKDVSSAASRMQGNSTRKSDSTRTQLEERAVSSGSVVATAEPFDSEYLCPVTLGGQTLNLDFDTGSADLWVFSSELAASSQTGHDIYNPAKSTTAKKLAGLTWNIAYGDGSSASGDVYSDTVKVGPVTIISQAVECAQNVSPEFLDDVDNDGLLGLSFSTGNTVTPTRQNTFFDTAINQGLKAVFTADLKKGAAGSYGFGLIDTTKYTGSLVYTAVDKSNSYWQFTATGYGYGNTYTTASLNGIVDTGTSLLLLPGSITNAYYAQVAGAAYDPNWGAITYPCSSTLPTFVVGISGTKFTLPGPYLNYAPLGDGTGKCYGGLQSSDGLGINIFGDIFIKGVFVVFDKTTPTAPRLGFATKKL